MSEFTELLFQIKSRKRPSTGDVFVLKPREDVYYYGKVIKTDIQSTNPFLSGWNLVYIYNFSSSSIVEESNLRLEVSDLLLPPVVTNNRGWSDGYFLTVANTCVSIEEQSLDYGYWDSISKTYRNEEGKLLDHQTKHVSGYGLISYGEIGRALDKFLIGETYSL
jgi:hypothetical protein